MKKFLNQQGSGPEAPQHGANMIFYTGLLQSLAVPTNTVDVVTAKLCNNPVKYFTDKKCSTTVQGAFSQEKPLYTPGVGVKDTDSWKDRSEPEIDRYCVSQYPRSKRRWNQRPKL